MSRNNLTQALGLRKCDANSRSEDCQRRRAIRATILDHDAGADNVAPPTAIAAPRKGSKLAAVVGLLLREGGATIDQLAAAMGWLPHTTRAALTGLRKRGFGVERRKEKGERAGAYVIFDGPNAAQG